MGPRDATGSHTGRLTFVSALQGVSELRQSSRPETAGLLIDFDNFDELRSEDDPARCAYVLGQLLRTYLKQLEDSPDRLVIRVYGGWDEGGVLSQRAAVVIQMLAEIDLFPIPSNGRLIAGQIELAFGPYSRPGLVLPNTYRRRGGPPRLRRHPELGQPPCTNNEHCSARILVKWTKMPNRICPTDSCSIMSKEAFIVHEQKMVDALIGVDLIDMLQSHQFTSVAIASNDSDFVPNLLHAAGQRPQSAGLIYSAGWNQQLLELLDDAGVRTVELL